MPHFDVNGASLEYLEQGSGDAIILVHGVLGDYRVWRHQMDGLSQGHRVIAYSRRNHYPNAWSDYPSDYTMGTERDDLAGLIRGLGLGSAHVVGSSFGAATAAVLARDEPSLVWTVTLNEPALRGLIDQDPDAAQVTARPNTLIVSTRESILAGRLEEAAKTWTDYLMGEGTFDRFPPPMRQLVVQNARPLLSELSVLPLSFTCEDAKKIKVPTLLMKGENTSPVFQRINERLAGCLPESENVSIPAASHSAYRQNPQSFNKTVLDFVAKH